MTASEVKDWVTAGAILVGGLWAIWRFGHQEWLRMRSEIPCLEGSTSPREIALHGDGKCIASLRWTWRNAGNRPVFIDTGKSVVRVYQVPADIEGVIDPRQKGDMLGPTVASHHPLLHLDPYMFEPGTSSSLLTPVVLPVGGTFVARMLLQADLEKHPTGETWGWQWERWQVFRTDAAAPNT